MDTSLVHVPTSDFEQRIMEGYLEQYITKNRSVFGVGERVTVGAHVGEGLFEVITWDPSTVGDEIVIGKIASPGTVIGTIAIEEHHADLVVIWQRA